MNNLTIAEDVNGENNMTSELDDAPFKRGLSQQNLPKQTKDGAANMATNEDLDFENAFNPYMHSTNNLSLQRKQTGASNNNKYKK